MYARSLLIALICSTPLACGEDASEGTKVAQECVQSDLIAQCPAGTAPMLDAQSKSQCEGAGELDLIEQNGSVSGKCYGEGSCTVLCEFPMACDCGVDSITAEGVTCTRCDDLPGCGDGACEGAENPDNCAVDCGPVCTPDRERCQGDNREICNVQGRWELAACGENQRCRESGGATQCEDF